MGAVDNVDDVGDELFEVVESLQKRMSAMEKEIRYIARYLRDEGFGPEDLDEDDD